MKKRILAMLLVLCMVVSVLPMTVLAAEAECPGKTKDHTLENCDATLVMSVEAETCLQQSYDLYTCDKCGVMFAANFGDFGPHNYQYPDWVPEEERYSCGAGMICVNQNIYAEDRDHMYCGAELDHQIGCDGKCSCGEEGTPGHDWDQKLIKITKEPEGCKVPGEATYHCGKCDATKIAPVYGKHIELKAVEEVEPNCTQPGLWAHEYCAGCDTYWIDGEEVSAEDVVRAPAHTHLAGQYESPVIGAGTHIQYKGVSGDVLKVIVTIPAGISVKMAHRYGNGDAKDIEFFAGSFGGDEVVVKIVSLEKGEYLNIFNPNSDEITVDVAVLSLENDLESWVEPACGEPGVYQVYCGEWDEEGALIAGCGALVTVETAPVEHAWVLEENRSQPATCEKYGYEFWICADCGTAKPVKMIAKLPCVDTWAEVLAYNAANKNNPIVPAYATPATCTEAGYYEWNCPHCEKTLEEVAAGKYEINHVIEPTKTWTPKATGCKLVRKTLAPLACRDGYTYTTCANKDCDNYDKHLDSAAAILIESLTGDCVHAVNSTLAKDAKYGHDWYLYSTGATCTEAGYEIYKCNTAGCKAGYQKAVSAYGHSGYIIPNSAEHKAYVKAEGEDPVNLLVTREATCYVNGESWYICSGCGEQIYVTKNVSFKHKALLSEADLLKYHSDANGNHKLVVIMEDDSMVNWDDITWEDWTIVPSCEEVGYINVECLNCSLYERHSSITVFAGGSHNFGDTSDLDCLDEAVRCQNPGCDETYKVNHNWSIPPVDANCEHDGHSGYGVCYNCGEKREKPEHIYYSKHDLANDSEIVPGCNKWGGQPMTCPLCDASVIIDYVKNLHYVNPYLSDESAIDNGGTVKKTQSGKLCQENVTVTEQCTVSGCKYKNEYKIPAIGHHVNYWDVAIDPTKCVDCIMKENNITELARPAMWYFCRHCNEFVWDNLGKDPTCTEEGYGVFAFTCGHNGYISHLEPLNHKYPNGGSAYKPANYGIYTCDECDKCGHQKNLKSTGNVALSITDDTKDKVITDGSLFTVTIDMSAYKTDLFGYSFKLYYIANMLEFVDYEVLTENFKYNALVNNNVELVEEGSIYDEDGNLVFGLYEGAVSVVGQSKTDGKNVTLTGTESLVQITFKVVNAEMFYQWMMDEVEPPYGGQVLALRGEEYLSFPMVLGDIEIVKNILNNKGKVVDVDYVPVIWWDDEYEYWWDIDIDDFIYHYVDVTRLMDADGNGVVNYRDAAIVWQMASGALEYNYLEHLDLNHNDTIDHVDAKLIYQYFVGILSYEEVLNYNA